MIVSAGWIPRSCVPIVDSRTEIQEASRRQLHSITGRRVSTVFVQRMLEAQNRERLQITAELARVKGLMPLLMRRRNGGNWSLAERHELLEQLHALAHLSPYLVVLVMPGSFLALPVLAWWLDRRRQDRDRLPVLR